MKNNCLFCAIIAGEIPSAKVYEDENVFAFRDINPQAPVHVLVVPNAAVVGKCFEAIAKIARSEGLETGYRVISNCGEDGGQSVMHLHFHLIGGRKLGEKII